jgi:hypothetical protein
MGNNQAAFKRAPQVEIKCERHFWTLSLCWLLPLSRSKWQSRPLAAPQRQREFLGLWLTSFGTPLAPRPRRLIINLAT